MELLSLFRVELFVLEAGVVTISIDTYLEYAEAVAEDLTEEEVLALHT